MTTLAIAIRPIKTERDHELAIRRIEQLMSAPSDGPESHELDLLASLVDAYETIIIQCKPRTRLCDRVSDGATRVKRKARG